MNGARESSPYSLTTTRARMNDSGELLSSIDAGRRSDRTANSEQTSPPPTSRSSTNRRRQDEMRPRRHKRRRTAHGMQLASEMDHRAGRGDDGNRRDQRPAQHRQPKDRRRRPRRSCTGTTPPVGTHQSIGNRRDHDREHQPDRSHSRTADQQCGEHHRDAQTQPHRPTLQRASQRRTKTACIDHMAAGCLGRMRQP